MKNIRTNASAGLFLAALAMATTIRPQPRNTRSLRWPDQTKVLEPLTARAAPRGLVALLHWPMRPDGVAVDSAGNVYVADTYNHTIRKVTPGGVVTTLAGLAGSSGTADGTGSAARFNYAIRRGGGQRGQRLCGGHSTTTRFGR